MSDTTVRFADVADLKKAYEGSYYFIAGAGGDIQEWVSGYEDLMKQQEIGTPTQWFSTNGATVNGFASQHHGSLIVDSDQFPGDLTCLLFPLSGLNSGKLPLFKVQMQDRWFDDVIQNMRTRND
jgi:hypothetical protein